MHCRYVFPLKHPILVERFFFSLQLIKLLYSNILTNVLTGVLVLIELHWYAICENTHTYPNSKFRAILVSNVTSHPFSRPNSSWILEKDIAFDPQLSCYPQGKHKRLVKKSSFTTNITP